VDLFVIGDVHGCYYTFKAMLEFWDPGKELLIQLGDLIDRGNFTPQVTKLCRELQSKNQNVVFLKGNHEWLALKYHDKDKDEGWYEKYGKKVLWQYTLEERDFEKDVEWMKSLPAYWTNNHVMVSHAGINDSPYCMDEDHYSGLLWHRMPIKNIGKLQVYGHTPQKDGKPHFEKASNSWNIDTGAYLGKALTALKLTEKGEVLDVLSIKTIEKDID
jgi:serine/threonine protein phosphatase 1